MTKEKEDIKSSFYNRYQVKIFILLGIAIIVLVIISITFIVRTIFTRVPILRFNITGGILAFSTLVHAIFTIVIYRSRDKKSPYRILLILALIFDILLMHGGIFSAIIYIGTYPSF
ncbi:MAG: hypothetical protein ACXAAM_09640 [Candidatus Heimdallarchaeaceae archaeon]|jgi:hypothetical protein